MTTPRPWIPLLCVPVVLACRAAPSTADTLGTSGHGPSTDVGTTTDSPTTEPATSSGLSVGDSDTTDVATTDVSTSEVATTDTSTDDTSTDTTTGGTTDDPPTGAIGLGDDGVLSIWTVGDSITEGVNNGYRNRLWTQLGAAGYTVDFVGSLVHPYPEAETCPDADHDGHAGYTIGGMHDEIVGWYAAAGSPDVVLLLAGTNDLAWWVAPGTRMQDVAAQTVALVDAVLALDPEFAIVVSTIPPMSSMAVPVDGIDRAELVVGYNAALIERLEQHAAFSDRLWHADINGVLQIDDLYDGVHPTREAHDVVADAWLAVLEPLLAPP